MPEVYCSLAQRGGASGLDRKGGDVAGTVAAACAALPMCCGNPASCPGALMSCEAWCTSGRCCELIGASGRFALWDATAAAARSLDFSSAAALAMTSGGHEGLGFGRWNPPAGLL